MTSRPRGQPLIEDMEAKNDSIQIFFVQKGSSQYFLKFF